MLQATIHTPPEWLMMVSAVAFLQIAASLWGYPLWLQWRARLFSPHKPAVTAAARTPSVCVVIAAHNEARYIQRRIRNLHEQTYPADSLRILVVCDGCSDNTAELAQAEGAEILILTNHSGKSHALNAATERLTTAELLVFTDARPLFAPDAIALLVEALRPHGIGAVSGVVKLSSPSQANSPVGRYWLKETELRQHQALLGVSTGCTGPICACWRRYWHGMPSGIVLDDVWLALDVAAQGGRVALCPDAIAWDDRDYHPQQEWRRKLRTSAGNWQLIFTPGFWPMLMRSGLFWHWLFHKWGRLMMPFSLMVLLSVVTFWCWPLMAVLAFVSIIGIKAGKPRMLQMLPYALAPVTGLVALLAGRVDGRWKSEPTDDTL